MCVLPLFRVDVACGCPLIIPFLSRISFKAKGVVDCEMDLTDWAEESSHIIKPESSSIAFRKWHSLCALCWFATNYILTDGENTESIDAKNRWMFTLLHSALSFYWKPSSLAILTKKKTSFLLSQNLWVHYFEEWPLRFVIHVIFMVQSWPDWVMFQRKIRALIDSCSAFLQFSWKLHSDVGQNARRQILHPIWCPISAGDVTQLDPARFISRINSDRAVLTAFHPTCAWLHSFVPGR